MLFCKGIGCHWRKQCSRYVLGRGVTPNTDVTAEWMDHCLHRHNDFERVADADAHPKFIHINPK